MVTNFNTYSIKEPLYTIIILVAILFGVNGIVLIVRGVLAEMKVPDSLNSKPSQTDPAISLEVITRLEKLAMLKEKGLLSQAEFDEQKHKLLEGKFTNSYVRKRNKRIVE